MKPIGTLLTLLTMAIAPGTCAGSDADVEGLYQQHCASCHGIDRLGGMGPALLPENLHRLRPDAARRVIADGRAATQMEGFANRLSSDAIARLTDHIYTPLAEIPRWDMAEIAASRIVHADPTKLSSTPLFKADTQNLFIVVELGDHHATLLDGDTFEPVHRFPTRMNLHGGPKYSPDGRFVYLASRDGWITKYDIYNLTPVAEARAGINTRNIAVSADGRFVVAANYLPHSISVLDADLRPLKVIPAAGRDGTSSRVSAIYTAPPRNSFIAALKDVREVWEINYQDPPPQGFGDWIHDHRPESGDTHKSEPFPLRRITVDDYLDDFFFDLHYTTVFGASRDGGKGLVVDLDTGHRLAELALPGFPHLGSGITWEYQGRRVLATPNIREGVVSIIDMESYEIIKRVETLGPGFFMRSHDNTPYAWVDVFFGPHKEAVHVIDKTTLEIVETLRPAPGKTAAHVEFTRDGSHALLSIWDDDGALIIYDADSLKEVKRLPMKKPSGKYNVHNKTHYRSGTSH